ncbi:MAG TPA: alpha/beta hydrolase [Candidatus Saccharimonadales bacterium]
MKKQTSKGRVKAFFKSKNLWWTVGGIIGVILLIMLAFKISPWPGAMVIRLVFEQDGMKQSQALEKHTPSVPIASITNQQYKQGDSDAVLDVYFPESIKDTNKRLPLLIWTHGGAWISGGRADHAAYFRLLAAEGFTVVSAGYSLGPERIYPTAVHQLNDMYGYIKQNAERFHVDTENVALAGDSAGAQLSSQMAAIITNPDYAKLVGVSPNLSASQLKGVVLNCGIYKMDQLIHPNPDLPKIIGWGDDISVWAYTGSRNAPETLRQMSAHYHVTKDFPETYITGGNADPLTDAQSRPFADELQALGVNVTRLFYPSDHQPALPHEYQFNLDNDDGKKALEATIAFLNKTLK